MSSTVTEQRAVLVIKSAILDTKNLLPYFDENDKTPFTDGFIDLHRPGSNVRKKSNFDKRVSVQIKGRAIPTSGKIPKRFRIKKVDLNGFLEVKGALYFVVFISEDGSEKTPHFIALNPFKIMNALDKANPRSDSVPFPLTPLPGDINAMEAVVKFLANAQSEDPSLGFDPILMEQVTEFTISSTKPIDLSKPLTLAYEDTDFSARMKTSGGMNVPLSGEFRVFPATYNWHPLDVPVTAGSFSYDDAQIRQVSDSMAEIKLGAGITLEVPIDSESEATGKIQVSPRMTFDGWRHDVGFFDALLETGFFEIGHGAFHFQGVDSSQFDQHRAEFQFIDKMAMLFAFLDINTSLLSFRDIGPKNTSALSALYGHLIEGKPPSNPNQESGRIHVALGVWRIELIATKDTHDGAIRYRGLFDSDLSGHFFTRADSESDYAPFTPYEAMSAADFSRTLNLNLGNIASSFESASSRPEITTSATNTILALLTAADITPDRRTEFLEAASSLCDWLQGSDNGEAHFAINQTQIIARQRELTFEERREIRQLRASLRASPEDENTRLAITSCAILLRDYEELELCIEGLSKEELERLHTWPIWHLATAPDTPAETEAQSSEGP